MAARCLAEAATEAKMGESTKARVECVIEIRDQSSSKANVTVKSEVEEVILLVTGMFPGKEYPVRIAAVNTMGPGPFASALLQVDPSMIVGHLSSSTSSSEVIGYTWLIALLGSLAFVLILISGVMLYYRRKGTRTHSQAKIGGYLAANTTDETTASSQSRVMISSTSNSLAKAQQPLWIDRRWQATLKDSNGSEKKLLGTLRNGTSGNGSSSNSEENEYAYIDRQNLGPFHTNGGGGTSIYEEHHQPHGMEDLEPYATTDILRQQRFNGGISTTSSARYIMPLSVTPMLHSRTARAADKRHKIYQRNARDARSCDNIDGLDQSSAYCYGRVIPPYAKVSVERMNGPFIPSFQGPPVYADGSFMPAQPYLYQPKANGSIYSNLNRQMAVGQMSPGKSHRVQPYAPVVHQLTQQLPPPLRLTDSCPSTYNSVSANQTDRKKKYHRNSRSSCSTFSNSESTPFLLNETPPQPSQRAQESLTPLLASKLTIFLLGVQWVSAAPKTFEEFLIEFNGDFEKPLREQGIEGFQDPYIPFVATHPDSTDNLCKIIPSLPEDECHGRKSTCWAPGSHDYDCIPTDLCCFDGCVNVCVTPDIPDLPEMPEIPDTYDPPPIYTVPVCETVYENRTEDKIEHICDIEYHEECHTTYVNKCEEKCKTHYETVTTTVHVEECTTEYFDNCTQVPTQECIKEWVPVTTTTHVEECHDVTEQVCHNETTPFCTWYDETVCHDEEITVTVPHTETECHTEYVEACEEVPDQECRTVEESKWVPKTEEQCKEVYKPECKEVDKELCYDIPNDECTTVSKPSTIHVNVTVCKTVHKTHCTTVYKEECTGSKFDSYTPYVCENVPHEECKPIATEKCTVHQKPMTTYIDEEVCKVVYHEQCDNFPEEVCHDVAHNECHDVTTHVEETFETQVCTNTTNSVCHEVPVQKCEEVTNHKEEQTTVEKCEKVPKEHCEDQTAQKCEDVTKEMCKSVPKETTIHVEEEKCKTVEVTKCDWYPEEVCKNVPKDETQEVPKEICVDVCSDKPVETCNMMPEEVCHEEVTPMVYPVPVEICKEVEA
eukprot:maker-scaffold402_size181965-snap-gene-0.24 protein:Tk03869 transcript:maker-scaffold402_size181965-snap-gene-0.24-mRNA-1 annotation:"spt transcription factor family member"